MSSTGLRAALARRSTTSSTAFALYCLVAFLAFGLRLLIEPGSQYVGFGPDPQIFIWSFAWWPHAILHGQNPFYTHEIWAPSGANLTWATTVPGLALVFSPLTLLVGAVGSYNVAATLIPACSAWAAFLLCRHVTRAFWPSLAGGYLFGFSSYELAQEQGHPHMTAVFCVPLVALVLLRYLEGELGEGGLVLRLAPLLAFQVLLSTELAFTLGLAVGAGLVLVVALVPQRRRRVASLLPSLAVSVGGAALLISPFLYYAVTGYQAASVNAPKAYLTDVLNLLVPTRVSLASFGVTGSIARHFPGNDSEQGAYIGLPALAILVLYAWRRWRTPTGRFLLAAIALGLFLSLGNELTVDGHRLLWLPWSVVIGAPFFDNALPMRLVVYAWLALAVVVALWTAARRPGLLRFALPALAILAILPNPADDVWATTYSIPDFFTQSSYRGCLAPNQVVLPLPVSREGDEMLWQVADGFRFRMAGGDIAPAAPASFVTSPEIQVVADGYPVPPDHAGVLRDYIDQKGVTAVLLDEGSAADFYSALATISSPDPIGGVLVYGVNGSTPSCIRG